MRLLLHPLLAGLTVATAIGCQTAPKPLPPAGQSAPPAPAAAAPTPAPEPREPAPLHLSGRVSGSVFQRERIALPPGAELRVSLVDATDESAPITIAEETAPVTRQVPIPFTLAYDRSAILPDHRYEIRAEIAQGSGVLFTTHGSHAVITNGHPERLDVLLQRTD